MRISAKYEPVRVFEKVTGRFSEHKFIHYPFDKIKPYE